MSALWVFGYGSLCWNPGFEFSNAHVGYVKGFKRRFWQGNDAHRGTPEKLGRVVTLIEKEEEVTWGKSFQMSDEVASREYLDNRESTLGGYTTIITTFYPRDQNVAPFPVLVYMATPENPQYLGPAPLPQIAHDIATSQGKAGHNVEYLAKLALFMRVNVPEVNDSHLFQLEYLCCQFLERMQPSLLSYFAIPTVNAILRQITTCSRLTVPAINQSCASSVNNEKDHTLYARYAHLDRELSWHRRLSDSSRAQLELMQQIFKQQLENEKKLSLTDSSDTSTDSFEQNTQTQFENVNETKSNDYMQQLEDSGGTTDSGSSSDSDTFDEDEGASNESGNDVLSEDIPRYRSTRPIAIGSSNCKLVRARSMDSRVCKTLGIVGGRYFASSAGRLEHREFGSLSEGSKSPPPTSHFIDFVNVRQLRCVKI